MEILLNGNTHQLGESLSVAELVANLNLSHQAIAVAVNRNVVARQHWEETRLAPNDHVDVVRAIGGG